MAFMAITNLNLTLDSKNAPRGDCLDAGVIEWSMGTVATLRVVAFVRSRLKTTLLFLIITVNHFGDRKINSN
jgi:hypothetical protein